jgi:hypothetical protein
MQNNVTSCILTFAFCISPALTFGQGLTPRPPGPYVIDIRGATSGIPQGPSFYPVVPDGTIIPARAFGIDLGGHVYAGRIGAARLGFGTSALYVRGTASPRAATVETLPDIDGTLILVAPQLSVNFGTADGWSYLSAGVGAQRFQGNQSGLPTASSRETDWMRTVNIGGGARWFTADHLALGFDVRFHVGGTPRTTLVSASVGIALR